MALGDIPAVKLLTFIKHKVTNDTALLNVIIKFTMHIIDIK